MLERPLNKCLVNLEVLTPKILGPDHGNSNESIDFSGEW